MTEPKRLRGRAAAARAAEQAERAREAEDSERALGRGVAVGLPVATVLGAVVIGLVASVGSALLVLAAGGLLGTIALMWASVRTLSGDAPLAEGFASQTSERGDLKSLLEEKRRALRALKDLENEHALGKIDDDDYRYVVEQYRAEAKRVMRAFDDAVAPYRDKAEQLVRAYLEKQGLGREAGYRERAGSSRREGDEDDAPSPGEEPDPRGEDLRGEASTSPRGAPPVERASCKACGASNEADAAFCKQCGIVMWEKRSTEKADVAS